MQNAAGGPPVRLKTLFLKKGWWCLEAAREKERGVAGGGPSSAGMRWLPMNAHHEE